jgi:hypothetical protein
MHSMVRGVLGMVGLLVFAYGCSSSDTGGGATSATSTGTATGSGGGGAACVEDACDGSVPCCEGHVCMTDNRCHQCSDKGMQCGDDSYPCCEGLTCSADGCCLAPGQTSCSSGSGGSGGGGTGGQCAADYKAKCVSDCQCEQSKSICQTLPDNWTEEQCGTALSSFDCKDATYCN